MGDLWIHSKVQVKLTLKLAWRKITLGKTFQFSDSENIRRPVWRMYKGAINGNTKYSHKTCVFPYRFLTVSLFSFFQSQTERMVQGEYLSAVTRAVYDCLRVQNMLSSFDTLSRINCFQTLQNPLLSLSLSPTHSHTHTHIHTHTGTCEHRNLSLLRYWQTCIWIQM